jgi:hypothetical protein
MRVIRGSTPFAALREALFRIEFPDVISAANGIFVRHLGSVAAALSSDIIATG